MLGTGARTPLIALTSVAIVGIAATRVFGGTDASSELPPQYSVVNPNASANEGPETWVQGVRVTADGRVEALVNTYTCGAVGRAWIDKADPGRVPVVHVQTLARGGDCAGAAWMLFVDLGPREQMGGHALVGFGEAAGSDAGDGELQAIRIEDCTQKPESGSLGLCDLQPMDGREGTR